MSCIQTAMSLAGTFLSWFPSDEIELQKLEWLSPLTTGDVWVVCADFLPPSSFFLQPSTFVLRSWQAPLQSTSLDHRLFTKKQLAVIQQWMPGLHARRLCYVMRHVSRSKSCLVIRRHGSRRWHTTCIDMQYSPDDARHLNACQQVTLLGTLQSWYHLLCWTKTGGFCLMAHGSVILSPQPLFEHVKGWQNKLTNFWLFVWVHTHSVHAVKFSFHCLPWTSGQSFGTLTTPVVSVLTIRTNSSREYLGVNCWWPNYWWPEFPPNTIFSTRNDQTNLR